MHLHVWPIAGDECLSPQIARTENARDFRALVGAEAIHPGLIILPRVDRERSFSLFQATIEYLEAMGDAMDVMVNRVLEVDADGAIRYFSLPVCMTQNFPMSFTDTILREPPCSFRNGTDTGLSVK